MNRCINEVLWTCDRCRAQERTADGGLPSGWTKIRRWSTTTSDDDGSDAVEMDLCGHCTNVVDGALAPSTTDR